MCSLPCGYPFKFGLQIGEIVGSNLRWLNETIKLLPSYLKDLGYKTHAVGKWHPVSYTHLTLPTITKV